MKAIPVTIAVVCIVGACIGGYYAIANSGGSSSRMIPLDSSFIQREKDGFWKTGNTTNPKATLLVYNDFQCTSCVAEYSIIQQALPQISNSVEVEFRNLPMTASDQNALAAAEAAEAAGAQGKFWQMYLLLYTNNSAWINLTGDALTTEFDQLAASLQIGITQFDQDLNSSMVQTQINADEDSANSFSITSAPSIVINNTLVSPPPPTTAALVAAINQAIAAK